MASSKIVKVFAILSDGDTAAEDTIKNLDCVKDNRYEITTRPIAGENIIDFLQKQLWGESDKVLVFIPKTLRDDEIGMYKFKAHSAMARVIKEDQWNLIPVLSEGETNTILSNEYSGFDILKATDSDFKEQVTEAILKPTGKPKWSDRKSMDVPHYQIDETYVERTWCENNLQTLCKKNRFVGIHGSPGIGKTTAAAAFSKKACSILHLHTKWIVVGQSVNALDTINQLKEDLTCSRGNFSTRKAAVDWLKSHTSQLPLFIVLDDIWNNSEGEMLARLFFEAVNEKCRVLMTSQEEDVFKTVRAKYFPLKHLNKDQSKQLLLSHANLKTGDVTNKAGLHEVVTTLLKKLNGNPLAITVIGSSLYTPNGNGPILDEWENTVDNYDEILKTESSPCYNKPLFASFDVSFQNLGGDHLKEIFLYFSVFKDDTKVPLTTLMKLNARYKSRFRNEDLRNGLRKLCRASLISTGLDEKKQNAFYTIHDLLLEYAQCKATEVYGGQWTQGVHRTILFEYYKTNAVDETRKRTYIQHIQDIAWSTVPYPLCFWLFKTRRWWELKDDGYLYENLAHHLLGAGDESELGILLLEFIWLLTKMESCGYPAVMSDFESIKNLDTKENLKLIKQSLDLSSFLICKERGQFTAQIAGRLFNNKAGVPSRFLNSIRSKLLESRLIIPINNYLTPPGGHLTKICSFQDNSAVIALVVCDGNVFAALGNSHVKVIRLDNSQEEILGGSNPHLCHTASLACIALGPGGQFIVTGSTEKGNQMKVWPLSKRSLRGCKPVNIPNGHSHFVYCVIITEDGRHLISGSADNTIHVRCIDGFQFGEDTELSKITKRNVLEGYHKGAVRGLAALGNKEFFSVGEDSIIAMWSLENKRPVHLIQDPSWNVLFKVSVTKDNKWVVTGGKDTILKVFSVAQFREGTNQSPKLLKGHQDEITAVKTTPVDDLLLSADNSGMICIWEISDFKCIRQLYGQSYGIKDVAFTCAANASVEHSNAISVSTDGFIKMWKGLLNPTTKIPSSREPHKDFVASISCDERGQFCATVCPDGSLKIWLTKTGDLLSTSTDLFTTQNQGQADIAKLTSVVIMRVDGKMLVLCGDKSGCLHCFQIIGQNVRAQWKQNIHRFSVVSMISTDEHGLLFTASTDNKLNAWKVSLKDRPKKVLTLKAPCFTAQDLALHSIECKLILVACFLNKVVYWVIPSTALGSDVILMTSDIAPWRTHEIPHPIQLPIVVSHLREKNIFFSAHDVDSRIRCFNVDDEHGLKKNSNFELTALITAMAITDDWKFLVVGNTRGKLRLMNNAEDPTDIRFKTAVDSPVSAISISPTQEAVFVGYGDGTLRMYMNGSSDTSRFPNCSNWPEPRVISKNPQCIVSHIVNFYVPRDAAHVVITSECRGASKISGSKERLNICMRIIKPGAIAVPSSQIHLNRKRHNRNACVTCLKLFIDASDNHLLFVGLSNGLLELFIFGRDDDTSYTPTPLLQKSYPLGIRTVAFNRSKSLAVAGLESNLLYVISVPSGDERRILTDGHFNIALVDFTSDGDNLMIYHDNKFIEVRTLSTGSSLTGYFPYQSRWSQTVRASTAHVLHFSTPSACKSRLYSIQSPRSVSPSNDQFTIQLRKDPLVLDTDIDACSITAAVFIGESFLVTASYGRDMKLWRIKGSEAPTIVETFYLEHVISSLVVSKDHKYLIAGLHRGQVCFFELQLEKYACK